MAQTVFVLGAGASHEAGAPLMRGFLDAASHVRQSIHLVPEDEYAFDLVHRGRLALKTVHSKADFDLRNVESVFGAFEMAKMFRRLPPLRIDEVEQLPAAMRRVIVRTIEWSMAFPVDPDDGGVRAHASHIAFARALKTLSGVEGCRSVGIITFNYDLGIDLALALEGFDVDYCLGEQAPDRGNRIEIAKLHGSLNWWVCANSTCKGYVETLRVDEYVRKNITPHSVDGRSVQLSLTDELDKTHSCGTETIAPYIVPPTWSKGEHHERIAVVWRRAASMLSEAENIVVMGYSWPPSDEFFHYLFALGTVGDAFLKRFWVFDPSPAVAQRYQQMLGPQATDPEVFQFFKATFGNAVGGLPVRLKDGPVVIPRMRFVIKPPQGKKHNEG